MVTMQEATDNLRRLTLPEQPDGIRVEERGQAATVEQAIREGRRNMLEGIRGRINDTMTEIIEYAETVRVLGIPEDITGFVETLLTEANDLRLLSDRIMDQTVALGARVQAQVVDGVEELPRDACYICGKQTIIGNREVVDGRFRHHQGDCPR